MIEPGSVKESDLKAIIAKGLLPYRGFGSGIKRALEARPEIDFIDDRNGWLFTAMVHRKVVKSSEKSLIMLKGEPELAAKEIARRLGISPLAVEKQIADPKERRLIWL